MKRIIIACLLLIIHHCIAAQDKMLTMEDAMLNARTTLAPKTLSQLQFIKGSNDYVYLSKNGGKDTWMRGNFKMTADTPFLSLDNLNYSLRLAGLDTVKNMPSIQFSTTAWTMKVNDSKIVLNPVLLRYNMLVDKSISSKEPGIN